MMATLHKEWFTPTTLQKMEMRKDKKTALMTAVPGSKGSNNEAHRKVKGSMRSDERGPSKTGRRNYSTEKHERPV